MKYYILGGYKGMTSKYNKIIEGPFNTHAEALHFKLCYKVFSLSLAEGKIIKK